MKIARRTLIQSGLGTATSIGLSALCLSARAQSALRVAAFVPEQSFGVSRVIKPWMAAVEKDQPTKVKLQGFWGVRWARILLSSTSWSRTELLMLPGCYLVTPRANSQICRPLNSRPFSVTR